MDLADAIFAFGDEFGNQCHGFIVVWDRVKRKQKDPRRDQAHTAGKKISLSR